MDDGILTKLNRENIFIWESVSDKVIAVLNGLLKRFKILLGALAFLLV